MWMEYVIQSVRTACVYSSSTGWVSGHWFEGSVSADIQYEEERAGGCTEGDVYIFLILNNKGNSVI